MNAHAIAIPSEEAHPVRIHVEPALEGRNRLTTAFRLILAIPHLILVGGPIAVAIAWSATGGNASDLNWDASASGGVLGAVAAVCGIIAWFALIFTGRHPSGLWRMAAFYLRWRVRAAAYLALLRDEYPPFGEDAYPARLALAPAAANRNRVSVLFRIILAIPQLVLIPFLGIALGCTTLVAWFAILFTGRYPAGLYHFAVGVLQWNIRVEAYVLLLHDEYPPFALGD